MDTKSSASGDLFNVVGFLIAYESGEASPLEVIEGFSHLIRTGQAWTLQGSYGRAARTLIDNGMLTAEGGITDDAIEYLDSLGEYDA